MSSFTTNSLSIVEVTPEQATEYLRYNYAHNRRPRQYHVQFLTNEMKAGRFMSTAEIHLMYVNGEPNLINGQHTCAAIVAYGKPVRVTLRKTHTKETGQLALTYAFGHDTGLRRTASDAMGAYNLAEVLNLTNRQIDFLAAALKHIIADFQGISTHTTKTKRIAVADLIDDMHTWAPLYRVLLRRMSGEDKKMFRLFQKRGCLSVALITMYYQTDKALGFWPAMIAPYGLMGNDPRWVARKKLVDSISGAGAKAIEPATLSRQLARCWNAYMENEYLERVYPQQDAALIRILGTPYDGKQTNGFIPLAPKLVEENLLSAT